MAKRSYARNRDVDDEAAVRSVVTRITSSGRDDLQWTRERRYVTGAMSIIGRRFRELDFDRQAVAEELCLSADYLGWLMKRYLGYGLINHLHVVRVAEAARLLQETHASVYAIARDCGYHTTAELDMHFKRRHGCTPTEFRLRRS